MKEQSIFLYLQCKACNFLLNSEDLCVYWDKLKKYNSQLSWIRQYMHDSHLVYLAQMQFKKSHYQKEIETLQMSNTVSGTLHRTLSKLCTGLECLDNSKNTICSFLGLDNICMILTLFILLRCSSKNLTTKKKLKHFRCPTLYLAHCTELLVNFVLVLNA